MGTANLYQNVVAGKQNPRAVSLIIVIMYVYING